MNGVYVVAAIAVITIAVVILVRWRTVPTYIVRSTDLARVLTELSTSTAFPAYALLTFSPSDKAGDDDVVSLQFSLEGGHLGVDWLLYQKRNIADEARFVDYARTAGFSPKRIESNRISYWRVEGGDLVALCTGVLADLYHVSPTLPIELIAEGFKWRA